MRLLSKASLRYLTTHRLQLVLSVLGVALGVAVVLSIDLAIESARTGFRISAETVAGRASHTIENDLGSLDESLLATIRSDFDIAAAPVVEGFATSEAIPGRALRVLGIDPFSEAPFRPWVSGGAQGGLVTPLITTRRGVALPGPLAAQAGIGAGDSLPVLVGGERWVLPVVVVVDVTDALARAGLSDVLLMDIAGAQEILRSTGRLSRIDVAIDRGTGVARGEAIAVGAAGGPTRASTVGGSTREEALRSVLPPGVSLVPAGVRSDTMAGMIGAFDVNLTALSLLALIFGMFLIYNAVTFSVVQRREILGRLRALGVTRGEIVRLILREAAWVGLAGAAIGIGAGLVLARGLVGMVSSTINDLYFAVTVQEIGLDPVLVLKAGALGVGSTLLAGLPAALEAAGANPRLSALRSVVESRARRLVPRAAAVGAALCLAGAMTLLVPTLSLVVSFTGLFLVITGLALITPASTLLAVSALQPILGKALGISGLMAARGVGSGLSRTAPAIAALVVAVSVTVGLGVMIQSFRGTLAQWLDGTLQADVYVSLPGPSASRATGTLWPGIVDAFVDHPDVVGHSTYRGADIVRAGDAFRLVALELDPRGEGAFQFLDGSADRIMAGFRAGEGAIVSEPYAFRRGLVPGDSIRLDGASGSVSLPIAGVFRDYGSEQGTVMISRGAYDRVFADPGITSLGLFLADGADSESVVRDLLAVVPVDRSVVVRTNDTLRTASLEVFDRTFRVTAVLRFLAFIVAFVGVLSALAALQLERARELGLLRAVGMTPGQLWTQVVTQTGLIGLVAGVLAVPMGVALSAVMILVVNKRSFGWTLSMQVGPEVVGQAIGLALAGAVLAGLYPAWRMARTSPALALRGE